MNQINELIVLSVLLAILILKPSNVLAYIQTHLGRIIMVGVLVYLALKNYAYGVIALALIVVFHEMNVTESLENMNKEKTKNTKEEDDNEDDEDDELTLDENDKEEIPSKMRKHYTSQNEKTKGVSISSNNKEGFVNNY